MVFLRLVGDHYYRHNCGIADAALEIMLLAGVAEIPPIVSEISTNDSLSPVVET